MLTSLEMSPFLFFFALGVSMWCPLERSPATP